MNNAIPTTKLFIFELSNNKWFLHVTRINDNYKIDQIKMECGLLYDFVKQNCPIKSHKCISINYDNDVDFYVKKYMRYYGIDNVRGGTHSDEIICPITQKYIIKELNYNLIEECSKSDKLRKILNNIDEFIDSNSQTEQCIELKRMKVDLINYKYAKSQLSKLNVSRDTINDIAWITERIDNLCNNPMQLLHNHVIDKYKISSDKLRYKSIITNLKNIKNMFCNYDTNVINFEPLIYINRPDIILDVFFYHALNETKLYALHDAKRVLEYFEYMTYFLINRKEEFEFDITTYDPDIEFITECYVNLTEKTMSII